MDELITILQTNTSMARFTRTEVKEIIERLERHGWVITKVKTLPVEKTDV